MIVTQFAIAEGHEQGWLRLVLTGELDMASAPQLEARLSQLRGEHAKVRLDLSRLEFIDSSGLHLLVRWFGSAADGGWDLEIDREVSPAVGRLFEIVGVQRLLA